jgi:hypothetical protein
MRLTTHNGRLPCSSSTEPSVYSKAIEKDLSAAEATKKLSYAHAASTRANPANRGGTVTVENKSS